MITRDDVKKKLEFRVADIDTKAAMSNSRRGGVRHSTRQTGTRGKGLNDKQINLERLTTKEYDALLGIESHYTEELENVASKQNKKKECEVKKRFEIGLGGKVNSTPNIYEFPFPGDVTDKVNVSAAIQGPVPVQVNAGKPSGKLTPRKDRLEKAASPRKQFSPGRQTSLDEKVSPLKQKSPNKKVSPVKSPTPNDRGHLLVSLSENANKDKLATVSEVNRSIDDFDSTFPLVSCKSTQTEDVFVACGCRECKGPLQDFVNLMIRNNVGCSGTSPSKQLSDGAAENSTMGSSNAKLLVDEAEEMVPLVKGCSLVKIPMIKKAALKNEVPNGDPSKMVYFLLDCLYSMKDQAKMTCDGKGRTGVVNPQKIPDKVFTVLNVYVSAKYNSKEFNFDNKLLKKFINDKWTLARRYMWKHHPELIGTDVRATLTKHTAKQGNKTNEDGKKSNDKSDKGSPNKDMDRSSRKRKIDRTHDQAKRKKISKYKDKQSKKTDRSDSRVWTSKEKRKVSRQRVEDKRVKDNQRSKPNSLKRPSSKESKTDHHQNKKEKKNFKDSHHNTEKELSKLPTSRSLSPIVDVSPKTSTPIEKFHPKTGGKCPKSPASLDVLRKKRIFESDSEADSDDKQISSDFVVDSTDCTESENSESAGSGSDSNDDLSE